MGVNAIIILAATGAVSNLFWSLLAERWSVKYAVIAAMGCVTGGIVVLLVAQNVPMVYLYSVLLGLGGPGEHALQTILYAACFGRLHLGTIRGIASPIMNLGWAMGPLIAAWTYDTTHSYQPIFSLFGGLTALGIVFMAMVRNPRNASAVRDGGSSG